MTPILLMHLRARDIETHANMYGRKLIIAGGRRPYFANVENTVAAIHQRAVNISKTVSSLPVCINRKLTSYLYMIGHGNTRVVVGSDAGKHCSTHSYQVHRQATGGGRSLKREQYKLAKLTMR